MELDNIGKQNAELEKKLQSMVGEGVSTVQKSSKENATLQLEKNVIKKVADTIDLERIKQSEA